MSKKAILVGVNVGGRDEEFIYSMEELRNLPMPVIWKSW